jgi:hypothetical protein
MQPFQHCIFPKRHLAHDPSAWRSSGIRPTPAATKKARGEAALTSDPKRRKVPVVAVATPQAKSTRPD